MDAAKDLLKRAVELDNAQRYTESLICYEEGIQNLLRAMSTRYYELYNVTTCNIDLCDLCACVISSRGCHFVSFFLCTVDRSDAEKREMRKKAEEYLKRAEEVKKLVKDNEGLSMKALFSHLIPRHCML